MMNKVFTILFSLLFSAIIFSSCAENDADYIDKENLVGKWALTRITLVEDNQSQVYTVDDFNFYLFLNFFDDYSYTYRVMENYNYDSGVGDWDFSSLGMKLFNLADSDIDSEYVLDNNILTLYTHEFAAFEADKVILEFVWDSNNLDPKLIGEWNLKETFFYRQNDTTSSTPTQDGFHVRMNYYSNFVFEEKITNNGNHTYIEGEWDSFLNLIRLYHDSGKEVYYCYTVNNNILEIRYSEFDDDKNETVYLKEIYQKN